MKKTSISSLFTLMAAVIVLTLLATGCTKETVTLRAQFEKFHAPNGQKLYIQEGTDGDNHSTFTPTWENDDPVYVNGSYTSIQVPASGDPTIEVVESSNGYTAIFTGGNASNNPVTNNGEAYTFTVPKTQYYNEVNGHQQINAPMYAHTSTGSTLLFKNMGALMLITLTNNTANETTPRDLIIDSVTVTASHVPLCGTATIDATDSDHPTYACTLTNNEDKTIYLDFTNLQDPIVLGATSNTTKSVYISVPPIASDQENHYTIRVCAHQSDRTIIKYTRQQNTQVPYNGSIGRSQIAQIPFGIDASRESIIGMLPPPGATTTTFRVGDNSYVYFSKGNLQYNCGTGSPQWRIAPNQYDYIGNDNQYITNNSYTGYIDLFAWGTSGHTYSPRSATTNTEGWNPSTSDLDANSDWGRYNTIYYGTQSSNPGTWRTMTYSEWNYLLSRRQFSDQHEGLGWSYEMVEVSSLSNQKGLLIYPDGYTNQICTTAVSRPRTINSLDDYIDAGCVFLPFAGRRNKISNTPSSPAVIEVVGVGTGGFYWTAAAVSPGSKAYAFSFAHSENPVAVNSLNKYYGFSVRLVSDAPTPTSK